jgi:hypothetical protein
VSHAFAVVPFRAEHAAAVPYATADVYIERERGV